jgi:hypothetical protein
MLLVNTVFHIVNGQQKYHVSWVGILLSLSLLLSDQAKSGVLSTSYTMNTGGSFPWDKTAVGSR